MNNFQGKRKDQYKKSAMFTWYGFLGALLIAICLTLCGCATTHETSKECCKSKKTTEKCD